MGASLALPLTLLAIPGVALLIAARLLFGRSAEGRTSSGRLSISLAGWIMIWIALIGGVFALCGLTVQAIVVVFMLVMVVAMVWIRHRRSEHRAIVGAIAAGMERGIPAPESARAMADEAGGRTGMRAFLLARALEAGMPLDLAIARARLWLSTGLNVAVRLGCVLGMPGQALKRELDARRSLEDIVRPLAPRVLYLVSLIVFGSVVLTFMMIYIVPVYDQMFREFGLRLPRVTVTLVLISRFLTAELSVPTVLLNLLLVHVFFFAVMAYIGVLPRNLPLLDRFFLRYDGSIVLRSLAWAVEAGVPLAQAIRLIGHTYPLSGVRQRLLSAAGRIEQGSDWCEDLRRTRLIGAADVAVLRSAERAGNLAWAMDEVSESLLRREVYRWQWWYNVVSPIVVVVFGFAVGFICVSLFLPLIALITGLSQ